MSNEVDTTWNDMFATSELAALSFTLSMDSDGELISPNLSWTEASRFSLIRSTLERFRSHFGRQRFLNALQVMANSDIENFVSDIEPSPRISARNQGPVRDLKTFLSIARQERAPLESSNTSNCIYSSNQGLDAPLAKKRQGLNGRTAEEQLSTASIDDGGRPCGEVSINDADSRQIPWDMLSARLDEDVGSTYSFHDTATLDFKLNRQTVESVQDSFRKLCAPRQLDRSNFFEGIIDVDREVGFGEDEDFERLQNEFGSESCKSSEFHPTTSHGKRSAEEGREEGHLPDGLGVTGSNSDTGGVNFGLVRERNRKFARSRSSIESGRARCDQIEDFLRCAIPQKPAFRRSLSNLYPPLPSHEDEQFKLGGDLSGDYQETGNKEWMPTKLESGEMHCIGMHSDNREREWEMESRNEGQANDDDIGMWKERVRIDEQEVSSCHLGQDYTLQRESEDMEDAIQDMLAEMRQENSVHESEESIQEEEPERSSLVHDAIRNRTTDNSGNPYSLIFLGFEDLLREADGRAERERKIVEHLVRVKEETEEAVRQQQLRWTETEKQMQSQINSLEMQHPRLLDMMRETEAAVTVEKERRKESRTEVDRILDMLKKERNSQKETVEKLSTCVNSLMKLRGNLAVQKSRAAEEGGPSYLQVVDTVLEDMDRELQMNLTQWTKKSTEVDYHSSDLDELSRWKQQRDALEAERDKVEENMTSLLRSTREIHEEMEAVWLERETLMEQKVGCLEVELQHSEMKQRRKEAEILAERVRWAEELQKHRKAWARERIAWESTLREREERLSTSIDCSPKATEGNCLVIANAVNKGSVQDSSAVSEDDFREMESKALQEGATNGTFSTQSTNSAFDDKISQFCVDVGNLALGIEAGVEKATEDLRLRESQWEIERMEWKELEENSKKERQEMEKRFLDTCALLEALKTEMTAKEAEMEAEKQEVQELLMKKGTDVEKLNFQLKSKEHDMEVTVQKFMDEVRLIDKEVEKERKEREQVMELHFASKRKVVTDMKEREEKWGLEIESMKQELDKAKIEVRHKEKEIEELKRSSVRAPSDRERQLTKAVSALQHEKDALAAELSKEKGEVRRAMEKMLADVWKVCEEEKIQAAVAKRLVPGEELSVQKPMWEFLWLEYCRNKGISDNHESVELESAVRKMARLEKEISEEKFVIHALRDELKMKGDQLLEAKAERERNWEEREKDWADQREKLNKLLESEQQKEREFVKEWQGREQALIREKEAVEKSFKLELAESAEAISNLQGVVRELEWVLKQSKSPEANHEHEESMIRRGLIQPAAKSTDLVKVHASYLEEVDRYILELEAKMEAAEKNHRSPERAFDRKWGGDPEMNLALMKIERELFSTPESKVPLNSSSPEADRSYFSPHGSRDWDVSGSGVTATRKRMPRQRAPRTPERNMCLTLNGLSTLAQDTWADGGDEHLPLWHFEDRNSMASWMSPRSSTEDLYPSHEMPAHGVVALPTNSPPTPLRRQQKWVVDVSWLEQVRKEHAWLRQQLEIERQRVAALGRVEADNRWIEAAIIRALELKRESDSKVADMQRKVNVMEGLISKYPRCSTP